MAKYYKHPKFGHVYGLPITTPIGRLVWPHLVTAKAPPPPKPGEAPGSPRFEVAVLIEKGPTADQFIKELKLMTDEMAVLFNDKRSAKLGEFRLLQDGDEADMEKYPYYKNRWVLVGRNVAETDVVDKKKQIMDRASVVGGMKGRLVVTPLITAHGASYKLGVTQIVEDDGVRYGGGTKDMTTLLDVIDGLSDVPEAEQAANEALVVQVAVAAETPKAASVAQVAPAAQATRSTRGKAAAVDLL